MPSTVLQARPETHGREMTAAHVAESLGRTHAMMADALVVPCPTHDARPGVYCIGSKSSGVRGTCRSRIERGFRDASRVVKALPQPPILVHTYSALPVPAARVR